MTTRWIYQEEADQAIVERLSADAGIPFILANILAQRGITTLEEARDFFEPSLEKLHDPFLMMDMQKSIERIEVAREKGEYILIYGDYDVDGTTSVALVYGFLRHFHSNLYFYIPDRYKEGYGLSKAGIDWAADHDCTLLISLDCGIKAVEMTNYANSKGIDVIIADHHLPGDVLPDAQAILDPKLVDCPYPFKELSGCGVGFKLLQAFCEATGNDPDLLYEYLDLIALSIAADIVPITGENRILAYHGLKKLNESPRLGIKALITHAGIRDEVTVSGIVFGIGPRINASGRMDHANTAVELLLADNYKQIDILASSLDTKNLKRRDFDSNITTEALAMIEGSELLKKAKSTVLFKADWHKGVIGIVASRCIDKFYRPTIILTESNGKATGSARSVNGFDIYEAISECADLLEQYGGHTYAAGLTLDLGNVEAFKNKFASIVEARIKDEQLIPLIEIDTEIDLEEIDFQFFDLLRKMEPFGPGNMQPVFVTHQLKVTGRPRILKGEHLKFFVKQEGYEKSKEAIGFGLAQYYDLIASGMRFSMAYYVEENSYRGEVSLQLRVKDIKFD